MSLWWQNSRIEEMLQKYRALSQRERILTLATVHIVIAAVYLLFIVLPIWNSAIQERTQANEIETNVLRMEAHLERMRSTPVLDPNESVRDDIQKVLSQKIIIDERISSLTDTLVSAEHMPKVLENMLTQDRSLKLISLENSAGENVVINDDFNDVNLFRHGVRIEMQADYPAVMDYLRRLDSMPWKLYWQSLDYTADNYPDGVLTLDVFTLSTREEILGD